MCERQFDKKEKKLNKECESQRKKKMQKAKERNIIKYFDGP